MVNVHIYYWNYIIPFLLFLIDYNFNMVMNEQLLFTLLCWFLLIFYSESTKAATTISFLLLGLSSSLYYGLFGLIYIAIIPTIILILLTKKWFTKSFFIPAIMLLLCLTTNNISIHYLLDLQKQPINYTIWQFCVNIMLLSVMSLKIHGFGRQGNRL